MLLTLSPSLRKKQNEMSNDKITHYLWLFLCVYFHVATCCVLHILYIEFYISLVICHLLFS